MQPALAGRVAVVTGAGRGLGRDVALALARQGASLALLARTDVELDALARHVRAEGQSAVTVPIDLARVRDLVPVIGRIEEELGTISILVNNAGAPGPFGSIWTVDPDEWERYLRLNLLTPYRLCVAVLPGMIALGWGRIVNVSSGAAVDPAGRFGAYSVSKAGVEMLTRQLAAELGDQLDVAVMSFAPGPLDTGLQQSLGKRPKSLIGEQSYERVQRARQRLEPAARAAQTIVELIASDADRLRKVRFEYRRDTGSR